MKLKKIGAFMVAACMAVCTTSVSFAADTREASREDVSQVQTFDLKQITAPEQIISRRVIPQPDGSYTEEIVTATKPVYVRGVGTTSVTTTHNAYSGGYTSGTKRATFTLKTNFWFNEADNTAGWSSGSTSYKQIASNISKISIDDPSGTSGKTITGKKWVKVSAGWMFDDGYGGGGTGTIWNKITSDGTLSESD